MGGRRGCSLCGVNLELAGVRVDCQVGDREVALRSSDLVTGETEGAAEHLGHAANDAEEADERAEVLGDRAEHGQEGQTANDGRLDGVRQFSELTDQCGHGRGQGDDDGKQGLDHLNEIALHVHADLLQRHRRIVENGIQLSLRLLSIFALIGDGLEDGGVPTVLVSEVSHQGLKARNLPGRGDRLRDNNGL